MTASHAPAHVHCAALSALLAHDPAGRPKSHVASAAGLTPANLRELETSVRSGARQATRIKVAEALGVGAAAITCWCDRPDDVCRSYQEADL